MKHQHAVLTLIDNEGSFDAKVTYQPSLKGRTVEEDSPSVNAMIRICVLLGKPEIKAQLAQPIQVAREQKPKKPLTFMQKVRNYLHAQ